jgi:hypothetical protein
MILRQGLVLGSIGVAVGLIVSFFACRAVMTVAWVASFDHLNYALFPRHRDTAARDHAERQLSAPARRASLVDPHARAAGRINFHGQGEFDHIHDVVPWPDMNDAGPMRRYAIPLDDPSVWKASPEHRRVIKTHLDWDLIPYSEDARYIAVIRDPKDVFVSSYFFFVKAGILRALMPSGDLWYRLFLSDAFPVGGSWAANTAGYWAQRHRPNVLVLSFKQMKRDLRGTVLHVAQFLNLNLPEAVLDEVVR